MVSNFIFTIAYNIFIPPNLVLHKDNEFVKESKNKLRKSLKIRI